MNRISNIEQEMLNDEVKRNTFDFIIPCSIFIICCFASAFCLSQSTNPQIDSLLTLLKKDKEDTNKVIHLYQLTRECELTGDFEKGLSCGNESLDLAHKLNFKKGIANASSALGNIYLGQADYPKALDYYFRALKLDEALNNKEGIAKRLGNIGVVYRKQGDYPKALDYYFRALKMDEELGNKQLQAINLGNIGSVYHEQAASPLTPLQRRGELQAKALDYYFRALKMAEELGNKDGIAINLGNIGALYTETGKFAEAEKYLQQAIAIDSAIGNQNDLRQNEEYLSALYDTTGRYKLALIHYKKAMVLKDTLFSEEKNKELTRKEMNYEFEKKEAAAKAESDKQAAVAAAEKQRQRIVLILVSCVLLLVLVFAGFIFRALRITRRQKALIEKQKKLVEEKQKEILDSIRYAKRIQDAILPTEKYIHKTLERHRAKMPK